MSEVEFTQILSQTKENPWCIIGPKNSLRSKAPKRKPSPILLLWAGTPSKFLRALFNLTLDSSSDGTSTASWDNLFQSLITLWVKNFLLTPNVSL